MCEEIQKDCCPPKPLHPRCCAAKQLKPASEPPKPIHWFSKWVANYLGYKIVPAKDLAVLPAHSFIIYDNMGIRLVFYLPGLLGLKLMKVGVGIYIILSHGIENISRNLLKL
jgi:hypothetical protein